MKQKQPLVGTPSAIVVVHCGCGGAPKKGDTRETICSSGMMVSLQVRRDRPPLAGLCQQARLDVD
jgi:hypothetical protein